MPEPVAAPAPLPPPPARINNPIDLNDIDLDAFIGGEPIAPPPTTPPQPLPTINELEEQLRPPNARAQPPTPNVTVAPDPVPITPDPAPPTATTSTPNHAPTKTATKTPNPALPSVADRIAAATALLQRTPLYNILRISPSHPLTAEYVRRHMQTLNLNYENPPKQPNTQRSWLTHIGATCKPPTPQDLTETDILQYLASLSALLEFTIIPNRDPNEPSYNQSNEAFRHLVTRPVLTYKLCVLPQTGIYHYRVPHTQIITEPLETKPMRVIATVSRANAMVTLQPNFSGLLAGIEIHSDRNRNLVAIHKPAYLHCLAYLATHLYKLHINPSETWANLIQQIANLKTQNPYNPPPHDQHRYLHRLCFAANLPVLTEEQLNKGTITKSPYTTAPTDTYQTYGLMPYPDLQATPDNDDDDDDDLDNNDPDPDDDDE